MSCCSSNTVNVYNQRNPANTVLHGAVRGNLNKWCRQDEQISSYAKIVFEKYLKCGIPAHGFARVHCDKCSRDFFLPFSCRQRGVCPSCATKRMVEVAAYLCDSVFPRIPVRQWVISFPKRLRPYLKNNDILRQVRKIVVEEIQARIIHCSSDLSTARTGGVSFFQCFGSKLNYHPHLMKG